MDTDNHIQTHIESDSVQERQSIVDEERLNEPAFLSQNIDHNDPKSHSNHIQNDNYIEQ